MWQAIILMVSPISELRGGIPLGIVLGYHPLLIFALAVVLNTLIYFPIRFVLNLTGDRLPLPYVKSVRKRSQPFINKYGKYGLALFVGIPLPYSGVYTATIVSWLLGFDTKTTIIPIAIGVIIAGTIVTLLTLGAQELS